MTKPLVVSIPHHLGREEAVRRIKAGLAHVRADYAKFITLQEETWTGDRLAFRVSALSQTANGSLDVAEDHVQLEVALPWLLGVVAERLMPLIRREGTLMLERK